VDEFHNNGCRDLTGDSEEGVFTHWVIKVGGSDRGTGSPLSPLPLRPGKRSLSPVGAFEPLSPGRLAQERVMGAAATVAGQQVLGALLSRCRMAWRVSVEYSPDPGPSRR